MATSTPRTDALAAVDRAVRIASDHGREDLRERLETTRQRLKRPEITAVVVGEFKQGKSALVNALLNAPACPVDDDVATAVPTIVRHASEPIGRAVHVADDGDEPVVERFDVEDAATYASERGNRGNHRRLQSVEIGLPRRLLASGLVLVDTPGVGGLDSMHGAATIRALPMADAVIFVTDASQEISGTELEFLRHAAELCPTIVPVVTKIDLYPEWRRIVDLDRGHLARVGVADDIIPVSSVLRAKAVASKDKDLNDESGFPRLVETLRHDIVARADVVAAAAGFHDVEQVGALLERSVRSEKEALENPDRAAELITELERAQRRAEDLRSQSSQWQVTLSDGISDLNADVDFDLRDRMRIISRDGEQSIEANDPADMWDEFEQWLYQRVTADVVDNFTLLTRRTEELVATVDEHFRVAEDDVLAGGEAVDTPLSTLEDLEVDAALEASKASVGASALTALRGSYGGVLMFGMIGNMVGLATMNPAVLAVGFIMGRKAMRDEKERQLAQRRQQAKLAMRKYLDEVSFRVGKESRDSLRAVQRQLRDLFRDRADMLQRSTSEALEAAKRAVKTDSEHRDRRLQQLDAQLRALQAVTARDA